MVHGSCLPTGPRVPNVLGSLMSPQMLMLESLTHSPSGCECSWRWVFTEVIQLKWVGAGRALTGGPASAYRPSTATFQRHCSPHSTDEETGAQIIEVTRPRSQPWMSQDSNPTQQNPNTQAHTRGAACGPASRCFTVHTPALEMRSALGWEQARATLSSASHPAEHMHSREGTVVCSFYPN